MLQVRGDEQFVSRTGRVRDDRTARCGDGLSASACGRWNGLAQGRERVRCAEEGGYCRTPYPTVVRYGSRGTFTDGRRSWIGCNNGVRRPAPRVVKSHYLARRDGGNGAGAVRRRRRAAGLMADLRERTRVRGSWLAQVRYGVEGRW